jgi:Beta protein
MLDRTHYVPILKGRMGEYGALETLDPDIKDALTPLIEIPPIPLDWEEEQPDKTIDEHLAKVAVNFQKAIGLERTFFVDLLWIPDSERMEDSSLPVDYVFRTARALRLLPVPVISLVSSDDFLAGVQDIIRVDRRGVALRIQREDFEEFDDLQREVLETIRKVSATPEETDLILDLRSILAPRQTDIDSLIELIGSTPRLSAWRSFTLSGTAFPENLSGMPPADSTLVRRTEWMLYRALRSRRRELERMPAFGDYTISHPEAPEVDPRIMRPSASIRYTTDEAWLILKGRNLRSNGFIQFHQVCRDLRKRPEYSGRRFSWGDGKISDCADERNGTGNLTTWRKVGTSHHLVFAVRQIASLYGS